MNRWFKYICRHFKASGKIKNDYTIAINVYKNSEGNYKNFAIVNANGYDTVICENGNITSGIDK